MSHLDGDHGNALHRLVAGVSTNQIISFLGTMLLAVVTSAWWVGSSISRTEAKLEEFDNWRTEIRTEFREISTLVRDLRLSETRTVEDRKALTDIERRLDELARKAAATRDAPGPSVEEVGRYLFENFAADLRGPVGPRGPQGPAGPTGQAGLDGGTVSSSLAGAGPVKLALTLSETGAAQAAGGFSVGFPVCTRKPTSTSCLFIVRNEQVGTEIFGVNRQQSQAITDTLKVL